MGEILRSEISLFNPEIVVDVRGKGLFTGVTIKEMKGQSVRDITHYKTLPIVSFSTVQWFSIVLCEFVLVTVHAASLY
jgi:acetylornithine/succinyldiaminopimelate/putrescine aminotransferase